MVREKSANNESPASLFGASDPEVEVAAEGSADKNARGEKNELKEDEGFSGCGL